LLYPVLLALSRSSCFIPLPLLHPASYCFIPLFLPANSRFYTPFFVRREAERHVTCDVEIVHPLHEDAAMDDRTVGDRGNANEAQRGPISPGDDEGSRNGRRGSAGATPSDPQSATTKPPLTERERGERWPLG